MTPQQQYIQWLDIEIEQYEEYEKGHLSDNVRSYTRGKIKSLEESRAIFITLFQINTDEKK